MGVLMQTPRPIPGESPVGYLIRLSEANGYPKASVVADMAQESDEYQITLGWDFNKLQGPLGPLAKLPPSFGYGMSQGKRNVTVRLQSQRLPSAHVGLQKSRICVQCIEELGYAPAAWDLKAFIACPVHGCMMLKHCSECGARIRWQRPGLLTCKCGAKFRTAATPLAPKALVGLCEILEAKVHGRGRGFVVATACGFPVSELMTCDLAILCKIVVTLAKLLLWLDAADRKPRRLEEISDRLPEVASILSDWPLNFGRFCSKWHKHLPAKRKHLSFQSNFKWLFVYLYKNLRHKRSQLLFMAKAALNYAGQRWDGTAVKARDSQLRPALENRRYGSYSDAAKLLGWTTYTTQRWLSSGRLPAKAIGTKKRRPSWVVDLDALSKLSFSTYPAVCIRDAARILGLPYSIYITLRREGVFASSRLLNNRRCVSREDIDAFRQLLVGRACPVTANVKLYAFREFLNSGIPVAEKVRVIREINDGRMSVYVRGKPSVQNLYTEIDLVAQVRKGMRSDKSELGVYDLIRLFQLSFHEARALAIHLGKNRKCCERGERYSVGHTTVERFLAKHMPLRALAAEMRVQSRALMRTLRSAQPAMVRLYPTGCNHQRSKKAIFAPFLLRSGVARAKRAARILGALVVSDRSSGRP